MEVFGPGGAERDIFLCLKVMLACCSTEMNLITTNINYNSGSHALNVRLKPPRYMHLLKIC